MAAYFNAAGLRTVAVHAGATSAPRAHSLAELQRGELNVVFAVDMFNEGIDIPDVDTVLMLRPTESRILWLQQFGRGLRHRFGKTLKVIDYIGNHRVFLTKTRALLDLGDSNRDVAYALDQYEAGSLELPPGCSVTYDLEAIQILRALVQPRAAAEALTAFYQDFRDRVGVRPSATEAYAEGYNPITARQHHGSWLGLVRDMGDFSVEQEEAWTGLREFFNQLEVTSMTKSYKMILLLAMLGEGAFPGEIYIDQLAERFGALARRYAAVRTEIGEDLDDPVKLRAMLERNPIEAWIGGRGTGDVRISATTPSDLRRHRTYKFPRTSRMRHRISCVRSLSGALRLIYVGRCLGRLPTALSVRSVTAMVGPFFSCRIAVRSPVFQKAGRMW
jgi:hypothetical protein